MVSVLFWHQERNAILAIHRGCRCDAVQGPILCQAMPVVLFPGFWTYMDAEKKATSSRQPRGATSRKPKIASADAALKHDNSAATLHDTLDTAPTSGTSDVEAGSGIRTVQRQHSLASLVRHEIEQMIERGDLVSGDWINEALIAAQLNVSRGTVREGCRSLQETGLVHVIVNRGAFVREIAIDEAAELYDLRAALFGLAGRTLARKVTKQQIAALNKSVQKMDKLAASGDAKGYYAENRTFHDTLLVFAGNKRLSEQYKAYARELQLFLRKALMRPGRMVDSNDEHRQIVLLIASRDADATARYMEQVVLNAKTRLFGDF